MSLGLVEAEAGLSLLMSGFLLYILPGVERGAGIQIELSKAPQWFGILPKSRCSEPVFRVESREIL